MHEPALDTVAYRCEMFIEKREINARQMCSDESVRGEFPAHDFQLIAA